jgi:feruloyl esterase
MMAQRYPELFDGIAAGAPSNFYPEVLMWLIWSGKVQTPVLGGPLPLTAAKRSFIAQKVHEACDANDGLVDGQITNPRQCTFNVASLRCTAGATETSSCLTDTEWNVTQQMYNGTNYGIGTPRWQGPVLGSEESWDPAFGDNGGYGKFVGHAVFSLESPPYNYRTDLNYSTDYDRVKAVLSPVTSAPSPDITAFKARGGKLLQYHGWNDPIVTPQSSINYYNAQAFFEKNKGLSKAAFDQRAASLSSAEVNSTTFEMLPTIQQSHRLFMLPEVGHCGGGSGPGAIGGGFTEPPKAFRTPDQHTVSALMRWVEQGVAPDAIIANRIVNGVSVRSRPVCAYPREAVYKGSGDINVAANFSCVMPTVDRLVATPMDIMQVQNALNQRELLTPTR